MAPIDGALVWSLFVWLASNGLSFFNALCQTSLIILWLAYALVLCWLLCQKAHLARKPAIHGFFRRCICLICFCALLSAIFYPPNMWDVHSYHLPRVMHWLQNHSLDPYPTSIPRQIGMPPFNSLVAMQSLGMDGGDYFVNLGQWLAYVGMIWAVGRLTTQMGGNARACLFAMLFIATLPNAIVHASNTESSNIVAFWMLAGASLFLSWRKKGDWRSLLKFGLCIGFAILSKGSAYVVALPFVAFVAFICLASPRKLLAQGILAGLVVIILNAPHYYRTYEAYGSPLGSAEKNILTNPTPGTFAVNTAYNFFLHLPWLMDDPLKSVWQGVSSKLGANEGNRNIFPWGGLDKALAKLDFGDASTANVLQALLILAMIIAITIRKFRPQPLYASLVGASFAMFCLVFTWHPWAARIHTILFGLAAPLAGLYMAGWKSGTARNCLAALLLLWACLAFEGGLRRLSIFDDNEKNFLYVPRQYLYFNAYKRYARPYIDMVNFLAAHNPESIGLKLTDDALEYPLWALMREKLARMPRIFHILSEDDRKRLMPRFIVVMEKGRGNTPLALPYVLECRGASCARIFPPLKNAKCREQDFGS